jgi:hypothetical protein
MKTHLSAHIGNVLKKLDKGVNIFNAPENVVRQTLQHAISEGKTYYSGCDNMDKDGRCAGHDK